jgi:hypothetical protein
MKLNIPYNGKIVGCHRIDFILNNTTQRYEKQPMKRDFKKVATDLRLEKTVLERIKVRSEFLLRGRTVNGKCALHLGLEKTAYLNLYRSALDDAKKSEVIIILSEDLQTMRFYVFNNLRVLRQDRPNLQSQLIKYLQSIGEW